MDPKRLKSVALFEGLSHKDLERLGRWADEVDVPEGKELIRQGRSAFEFFVIEDGTADVTRDGAPVGTLGPSDFFGELGLLQRVPRTATVVATSPMRLIVMARREFGSMEAAMPGVARQLRARLDERLVRDFGGAEGDAASDGVPARLIIVTLGVSDLGRSQAFYDALGWERTSSSQESICWYRTADSYVGLFAREELARDANLPAEPRAPFGGVTLAICVDSEAAVTAAIEAASRAGAKIVKPPVRAEWGGFSGYFTDPDGHPWEVAFNPNFPIGEDGRVTIP
ncbi:MAG TPA: cyclic nucleotide-binding domain-containing protein [Actinomycetota bacterium]|nr:cyclic nucleotide-binding domain-containing protein [Actinomycetota bacterium]